MIHYAAVQPDIIYHACAVVTNQNAHLLMMWNIDFLKHKSYEVWWMVVMVLNIHDNALSRYRVRQSPNKKLNICRVIFPYIATITSKPLAGNFICQS